MNMRTQARALKAATLPLLLAMATTATHAATPLLPASNGDQVPGRLVVLPPPTGDHERQAVSYAWKLDPTARVEAAAPFEAESREYWMTVAGAELEQGVDVSLTAPGSLIRVNPARGARAMAPTQLRVSQGGRRVKLQSLADSAQLQAAGMPITAGTSIVKLEAGAGRYRLQAEGARGDYVVHVYEPQSDVVLRARPDRQQVLAGGRMQVAVDLERAGRPVPGKAEALLVAPDGSSTPVAVRGGRDGRNVARFKLPEATGNARGLWELQVFANDGEVARDARTAFAVAAPTARLAGDFEVDPARLQVSLPVEVASTGRFEVRGTLYATAADGAMAPVSQAHAANWFEAGKRRLTLSFDRSHLPTGYGRPFELRQLELHDQTRMSPIESREYALKF
ncbi:DUF4785 family protein [Lysobacter aestuarii]|uniref:DUF4785 family protein n=2 Tax=Marilutibacter aestuarii TaxID=1706195 RepID=A0A508A278_9GAMM|nr:DUF4785 family protein [Lysobacter aestuarii]